MHEVDISESQTSEMGRGPPEGHAQTAKAGGLKIARKSQVFDRQGSSEEMLDSCCFHLPSLTRLGLHVGGRPNGLGVPTSLAAIA